MLETSRRSAINTSELGLYSDRGDRYHRNRYGLIARKLAIGVMVVVTIVLVAIFMYDFTSATSGNSKLNQETKHIYILQNALKKSANLSKKPIANSTISPSESGINRTELFSLEDRSDNANDEDPAQRNAAADLMSAETRVVKTSELESRAQNLHNFKQRKRVLKSVEDAKENEEPEAKQLFDNHAIVYRVRQRYKIPDLDEETSMEEARPTPFHWEFKTPHPTSFKRPRYPQLSHASRSIQDIIKYLTDDAERPHRGIKFTGVYMNPKKYDQISGISEMMSNNDKSEVDETSSYPITYSNDPFYQYKPKHPADVNLLATSNVRFSPSGIHRYSPYYDSVYTHPLITYNKPVLAETQYETVGSYSTNNPAKNRKPKPFSVMLDIYPITDIVEQNKKTSWPRPQQGFTDDHDFGKPLQYPRGGPKFYASASQPPIPLVAVPNPTTLPEEEERQQMIFHLNLYPRKKNKLSRYDIIHRSESMGVEERQQFAKRIMSPLETIAKHLTDHSAIEESKLDEAISLPLTRYHEISLDEDKDEKDINLALDKNLDADNEDDGVEENITVPSNHKLSDDEDYASAERYESDGQEEMTSVEKDCANCDSATTVDNSKTNAKNIDIPKDIDTVEGFHRFSDGLLRPH